MSFWQIIVEIVKTGGVVSAATAFCLSYVTLRQEYKWRRNKFTVDLFLRSDAQSHADLAILVRAFPHLLAKNPGEGPTEEECRAILNALPGQKIKGKFDGFELRRAILEQFNSIEPVAMAYNYKLVDLDAIDKSVGTVILRRYDFFHNFVRATEKLRGDHPWPSIPTLIDHLKRKRRSALARKAFN